MLWFEEVKLLYNIDAWNSYPGQPCRHCLVSTRRSGSDKTVVPLGDVDLRGENGNNIIADSKSGQNGLHGGCDFGKVSPCY